MISILQEKWKRTDAFLLCSGNTFRKYVLCEPIAKIVKKIWKSKKKIRETRVKKGCAIALRKKSHWQLSVEYIDNSQGESRGLCKSVSKFSGVSELKMQKLIDLCEGACWKALGPSCGLCPSQRWFANWALFSNRQLIWRSCWTRKKPCALYLYVGALSTILSCGYSEDLLLLTLLISTIK